ncbi:release factor glutamine methyltransferase [Nocardioides baekrokdamisoli]|uniref:Release factor glutamine methyltransferase n=1 Tax=Nocardioides baekrokdamisoli TaxID=1804624 RepID=A0A3G9IYT2_9ACTN|nr:peptide chain release factor N(5)-glutamine methyltransferase [Nocardioides baekrokdamisoli]BBH16354.1 release factor glutamine methyltransferase [Nocardioides baekrokdamisoli]
MSRPRDLIAAAAGRLAGAGVESPQSDATELLTHVLKVTRSQLTLVDEIDAAAEAEYEALVAQRATRIPLQHLTGVAYFRHVELQVGPGVFIPRPETELLAGWAIDAADPAGRVDAEGGVSRSPIVLDLCTGSGAIAKAVKDECPAAEVHAVELSVDAFAWAEKNLAGIDVDLRQGDAFKAFDDLVGTVDVIACNPPYIPLEAWESVALEARDHDPQIALFSGQDGLDAIRLLELRAAELLRPGGVVGVEHADAQGESAPEVFRATGRWSDVRDHKDLAGRARFLTARLRG